MRVFWFTCSNRNTLDSKSDFWASILHIHINGALFLNVTCLSFLSLVAGVFAATLMIPLKNMYALL